MSLKAVVFAYHDIGCTGIEALLNAGYDIAAVFTHADDPSENNFYGSVANCAPVKAFRYTLRKMLTTHCGSSAFAS